jgi:mannose-6-phosphate isomerase-like protein (cupin superfamily)
VLADRSSWIEALTAASLAAIAPLLAEDVKLRNGSVGVTGRHSVSRALGGLIGDGTGESRVVELGCPTLLAVYRTGDESQRSSCFLIRTEFNSEGRAAGVVIQHVQGPTPQIGVAHDNEAPIDLLGARSRELAEGIVVGAFGAAKRVNKRWGDETWLHSQTLPFGFKVIRLRAGCRTSLQYHQKKAEVYFVLDGLARLHFRTDGGTMATAPFIYGTVATVQPLAWHRVEAITDVTMIEASTFDDGSDNIRIEDDYGRPSGHIEAEHEA